MCETVSMHSEVSFNTPINKSPYLTHLILTKFLTEFSKGKMSRQMRFPTMWYVQPA